WIRPPPGSVKDFSGARSFWQWSMSFSSSETSPSPILNMPSYAASGGVASSLPRSNSWFWIFLRTSSSQRWRSRPAPRPVLLSASVIHFLHDGFSETLYVFLPLWASEFGLSLTQVGLIRTAYTGGMSAFQIPAGFLAERLGERRILALGTAVTALGFVAAGWAGGFVSLLALLLCAGRAEAHDAADWTPPSGWGIRDGRGFGALCGIGMIDNATRTGFLTFMPFILMAKGLGVGGVGLAFALVFAGGATGKFVCGVV